MRPRTGLLRGDTDNIMSFQSPLDQAASPDETEFGHGKGKHRAKQSCIPCRTRKVKCDRIKPCQACCVRGLPSQCEYVSSSEDRHLISQADAIENLRSEVERLRQRLADVGTSSSESASASASASSSTAHEPRPAATPSQRAVSQPSGAAMSPSLLYPAPASAPVPYEKYDALQSLFDVIANAAPAEVADTVAQVRNGVPLENVVQMARCRTDVSAGGQELHVFRATEYPSPSNSNRGDFDYPEAKRLKRGGDADVDADADHDHDHDQIANPVSPSLHHSFPTPFNIALRSKSAAQGNADFDSQAKLEDDSSEDEEAYRALLPHDHQTCRKRRHSRLPVTRPVTGRDATTMDVFLARFVDSFSPKAEGGWGSSTTMRSAAEIRMFSPILRNALEAVSVTYFGQATSDSRLEFAAYDTYLSVLRSLQHALYDPELSKSRAILLTVFVLMAFETIQRTTSGSIVNHARGALKLIEHRGADRHMHGVEHLFFCEFRPYLACIALVVREPTFLEKDEWKVVPWSAESVIKDSLQLLLDVVVDIPALLHEYDKLMASSDDGSLSYAADTSTAQTLLSTWVAQLDHRLRRWKEEQVDAQPDGPAKDGTIVSDNQFPVFQCRDLDTMEIITPKPLVYSDLRHAQTMCIYYSAHLVLATVDTRSVGRITSREQYIFACNICRSMEFYIRTIPGGLTNRVAFPLRVAYDALPEGDIERRFVEELFHLVEEKFKLRLFGSMIPEISARKALAIEWK